MITVVSCPKLVIKKSVFRFLLLHPHLDEVQVF